MRPLLLGAHLSIAGGVSRAVERAEPYGMTALQIFTRSARTWTCPPLADDEAERFRAALAASKVRAACAHATYLANVASPDRNARRRSERALVDELTRCERLGLPWLVLHPGSRRGTTGGVKRAGAAIRRVLSATSGFAAGILVENCAGQGDSLGDTFTEIGAVLAGAGDGERLGMCLDTCHAFAAGYDLRTEEGFASARDEIDDRVGLVRVRVVHVNDSVRELGSRVDRHAGIGLGAMGEEPFRRLLADPVLGRLPLILETPKEGPAGEDLDARNLAILHDLQIGV
ncbi:MAG: deoxyribonuclease IV [Planctomycetota bacterium]